MSYRVVLKASAAKELEKLPVGAQERILDALKLLAVDPFSRILPLRKMHGSPSTFRLRVGDYRVVYDVDRDKVVIYVVRVGHRKDVYR